MSTIAQNVARVRQQIREAALAAGRDPEEILLCAATKMNDAAAVRAAIAAGVDCCGENRVQELVQKAGEDAYRGAPVHFIGHLQTNKVRQVVGKVDLIQSADRRNLLEALEKEAARQGIVQAVLLEVNIGGEASKSGFSVPELWEELEEFGKYPHLRARGLMAIPPVSTYPGENLQFFSEMSQLFVDISGKKYDNVSMAQLSMGMSGDFPDAIACGSTMVRVGTAIFGPRDYHSV
ncbi:MAG: YggS family pyridoxal phosphate-dependent enzyme [Clostridiales bacterium]|nr:YggS family pyridoxal phosphate-dependent enzyme [Clostridiales bacterium]